MELLRNVAAYERSKKKRDEKIYLFVRKQQFGKVERNVYAKVHKLPGGDTKKLEYVKYNGKYMQLVNYKDLMKKKNLYKSPSPTKAASPKASSPGDGKKCKKDCVALGKVCNKKTGRCIAKKASKSSGQKECKTDCSLKNKVCNKTTGRCNKK